MEVVIHDMRVSCDERLLGTSRCHKIITLWDSKSFREIASVKPDFDGGDDRMAIDSASSRIFSGTWEDGLTCYDFASDQVIWHRDDLIGIQRVDFSHAFPTSLFLAMEEPDYRVGEAGTFTGVVELDARTGRNRWETDEATTIYLHPNEPVMVLSNGATRMIRIFDGARKLLGSTPMANFAILDVAFHRDRIAIAEGVKGVRLTDFQGRELASYRAPSREPNCLNVAFTETADAVIVYDSRKGSYVTRLDGAGRFVEEYERDVHGSISFFRHGTRFLDIYGRICRTSDGSVEGTIAVH